MSLGIMYREDIQYLYRTFGYSIKSIARVYGIAEAEIVDMLGGLYDPNVVTTDIPEDVSINQVMKFISRCYVLDSTIMVCNQGLSENLPKVSLMVGKKEPWKFKKYETFPKWYKEIITSDETDKIKADKVMEYLGSTMQQWFDSLNDLEPFTELSCFTVFLSRMNRMYTKGLGDFLQAVAFSVVGSDAVEDTYKYVAEIVPFGYQLGDVALYRFFLNYCVDMHMLGDILISCYGIVRDTNPLVCLNIDDVFSFIEENSTGKHAELYLRFLSRNGYSLADIYSKEIRYLYNIKGVSIKGISSFYNIPVSAVHGILGNDANRKISRTDVIEGDRVRISREMLAANTGNIVYVY